MDKQIRKILMSAWKREYKRILLSANFVRFAFVVALTLCFLEECFLLVFPRYNSAILVCLVATSEFPYYLPIQRIRPFLLLTSVALISIMLDILFITFNVPALLLVLSIIYINIAKLLLIGTILLTERTEVKKARKYLWRRTRTFFPFFKYPTRRYMREIRARIVSIGLVEFIISLLFLCFFLASISLFDYISLTVSSRGSWSLSWWLLGKTGASLLVFAGVLHDTDVLLCLSYYGCLVFCMGYARDRINRKKLALGGWPLMYAFNSTRFKILFCIKLVDAGVGAMCWVALREKGALAGTSFFTLPWRVRLFLSCIMLTLVVSDVWVTILFAYVLALIARVRDLRVMGVFPESDDSEIDDLKLRLKDGDCHSCYSSPVAFGSKTRKIAPQDSDEDEVICMTNNMITSIDMRHRSVDPSSEHPTTDSLGSSTDQFYSAASIKARLGTRVASL